jgi:acylphosphatase
MNRTIHFVVTGRVQGVFFRASCKKEADRLDVKGWVRNLPDRRVEGMATAEPAKLKEFRKWLQQGPRLARVSKLEVDEQPVQQFDEFEIR